MTRSSPYITLMQWTLTHPVDGGVPMVNVSYPELKVTEVDDAKHSSSLAANKRTRKKRAQRKRAAARKKLMNGKATLGDVWTIP